MGEGEIDGLGEGGKGGGLGEWEKGRMGDGRMGEGRMEKRKRGYGEGGQSMRVPLPGGDRGGFLKS